MASYQDLSTSKVNVDSALVAMQADMAAAIKNKQGTDILKNDKLAEPINSDDSKRYLESTINAAGENVLDEVQLSRVIEMAWEDRTPFDVIEYSYGLDEAGVIKLMRQALKPSSFRLWRQWVSNRATKHQAKRGFDVGRAYCKTQYKPR